jgi:cell division inhibitor SulA
MVKIMPPTSREQKAAIEQLLQRPDIWQSARRRQQQSGVSTGFAALDDCLHLGGWPRSSMVEMLCRQQGIGELQLLLPTLARLTNAGRYCLLLSPPCTPYPAALAAAGVSVDRLLVIDSSNTLQQLWSAEQTLRSGAAGCVIAWFGAQKLATAHLRKLLLATKHNDNLLFLQRHYNLSQQASPAGLRLLLDSTRAGQLQLEVLKQPGGWSGQSVTLPRREAWLALSRWHLPLQFNTRAPLEDAAAIAANGPIIGSGRGCAVTGVQSSPVNPFSETGNGQ